MGEQIRYVLEDLSNNHWVLSLLCVTAIICMRIVLVSIIERRVEAVGDSRRWASNVKNTLTALMLYGLVVIWSRELQDFVFSVAAFLVAIVIGFKEFIVCIVGGLYQAASRPFSVGDWIQIDHYTGEVVDRDWVSTTLLDIDVENGTFDFTGKTLELPNSLFLSHVVQKLHFMRRYVLHRFEICRPPEVNVCLLRPLVLTTATKACAHFQDIAERYQGLIQKRLGISLPGPDPEVRVSTNSTGHNVVSISVFCPVDEAVAIEQIVTETFMAAWYREYQNQTVSR